MPSVAAEAGPAVAGPPPLRMRRTVWGPSHRLIPSRFPPVGLFDRVVDPQDLEAVYALESMTNDRMREEAGNLQLVPPAERVAGPGTTPIMAAFTHLNPEGSRFSDGTYGVYYCSQKLATALAEVRFHQERFLRRTAERPIRVELRLYLSNLDARLLDVRKRPEFHDELDYGPGQHLGRSLRAENRDGVLYRSVRHEGALCAAVFRPSVLGPCQQSTHYAMHFDGARIVAVDELSSVWTLRDDGPARRAPSALLRK